MFSFVIRPAARMILSLCAFSVVTSLVTPSSGPANVYTAITVTGSGCTGTSAISISGKSLRTGDWVVISDTTITTQTPTVFGNGDVPGRSRDTAWSCEFPSVEVI